MLTVIVRNTDFKDPYLQIQLYMSVTNGLKTYIQTKSPNISKIFQIGSGETLTLTGQDLECIFNTYYLNYKKPNFQDGQNILKIYARDTRTGKIVSNTAQILLKSVMIAPPKLTSPDENFTIETDNQFFNFAWRGDNGGANIATRCNYRYKFELWKQNFSDKNVEAQRPADFTMENLFDEKYQFLLATFPFEIGQKYCWRVTAYDPLEKATFLQNGKSEVRSFIYKHLPVPVTGLKHTINERNRQATVTWNAAEGHTKYYVEYYNPQTTKTIAMEKDEPKFTLASAPEKEYTILFRVKAQCWGDDSRCSNWSDWDTIKYAAPEIVESKYPCGYQFPKVEITNFELKTDFKEGDIVSEANGSSDYEIINCKSDGNGVLQGQFYLIMNAWGGAKIACDFWDTKINTDNQIITTRYRSIDTPVGMVEPEELTNYIKSLWLDGNSLTTSSKIRDTIVIDQKFDYLYRRENGEFVAVVVNSDGSTTETEFDLHKNPSQTLITDGKGDSLVYSQNGHLMGIKEYRATGGNAALLKDYHRKSDSLAQWKINFLPDTATQIYGFDYLGSGNHGIYSGSEYYPSVNGYDLRYKSVECYKTDKVIVDFGSYPERDSVVFKDKWGVKLKVSKGNVLNFTGVAKPDTNYIYAYRGDEKIGKLSINTYKQKTYKVVLVSVNGAKMPEANDLENYLNEVYKQAAVSFEVETDELNIENLFPFLHGDKRRFSGYNDDQKRVLTAYNSRIKPDINYLFFIPDGAETNGVAGYNPLSYNFGFIYFGAGERTIAHELAHGIASLEHPFQDDIQTKGKTENLLDYNDGVALWHFQWDKLQNPPNRIFKWNFEEEDAEGVEELNPLISFKVSGKITAENSYANGDLFATLHTNDEIIIELISQDTTVNISQLTWHFDKTQLSTIDSTNSKVKIILDEKTISLKGNTLYIRNTQNKEVAKLKFQAYLPPYVEFSIDENDRGKFFWDDSFRRINKDDIYNPAEFFACYDHNLTVGKDNKKYYAPVLGLQKDHEAYIMLNFKEFDKLAQQDKNFKIVIKSDNPSIEINEKTSLEINSSNIDKYKSKGVIKVQFSKILQEEEKATTGVLLYAEIPSLNKKIGLIECFCKNVVKKAVTLIYVRFSPKSTYPVYDYKKLENYLNNYSFNQLFVSFELDTVHLDAFVDTNAVWYKKLDAYDKKLAKSAYSRDITSLANINDDFIFDYLNLHMSGEYIKRIDYNIEIPVDKNRYKRILDNSGDYYFITDINKCDSTYLNGNYFYTTIGGFHNSGERGGVHLQVTKLEYGQILEELDAHEFGHWLGLQHVYEDNTDYIDCQSTTVIRFTKSKSNPGQSIDNFMDYNIKRKSWFKNQLINIK